MKVSVVLSTYNGSKYIIDLLESLKNQSYFIDEVLISDDGSTDNTVKIIKEFIDKNQLNHWKLRENIQNLGWKVNFKRLIYAATGDLIFPCDQDDIWVENKIEDMINVMKNNFEIEVLASDYFSFKEKIDYNIKIKRNPNEVIKIKYQKFFYIKRPGCTYCIRKSILNDIEKYWNDDFPHDAFLWRMSALRDSLYLLKEETILYRRHSETATGREEKNYKNRILDLEHYSSFLEKIRKYMYDVNLSEEKKYLIGKYISWIEHRKRLITSLNIYDVIWLLLNLKYYWGIKSYLLDLYLSVKKTR